MAKNLDNISGHNIKESRLCLVRRVYDENTIDLRTLSTIYYDKDKKNPCQNYERGSIGSSKLI